MAEYEIVGGRARAIDPDRLLGQLQSLKHGRALVLDAGMICGREHLESAVEHAIRAFERDTNSANDIMMETMLYASGERQISKAREKMGLRVSSEGVALVLFGAHKDDVLLITGLEEDESVLECNEDKLARFGIGARELEAAPPGKAKDLVLERVAFVEILKR
jgi:KEOPS complex subunit Cgi121